LLKACRYIVVLALLVIFFFGFLAFDYEVLGFHRPIIIITIPNETEQYFEAIPWIIFGVLSEDGRLIDEAYNKRVSKFLAEFEWYIEAFKNQRAKGTPY
jgi:hypothetical protein